MVDVEFLTTLVHMLDLEVVRQTPRLWCRISQLASATYLDIHECDRDKYIEDICCCAKVYFRFWEEMKTRYPNLEELAAECGALFPRRCPMFENATDLLLWLTKLTGLPFVLAM